MTRLLVEGPAEEPVSLAEAKAYLRVEQSEEDALIGTLIGAARGEIEAATRRVLVTQTWRIYLSEWPAGGLVRLGLSPVRRIVSLMGFDADGMAREVENFRLDAAASRLSLGAGSAANGLEIDVEAGYGGAGEVPAGLKLAVLQLVAHWYAHREAGEAVRLMPIPFGVERATMPFKVLAL